MLRLPALAAAGLMAVAGGAWGQAVTLEPSAVQRCLTGPGEPEYPFAAWKKGQKATVEAQLRFEAPDRAPEVELRTTAADDVAPDFAAAVKAHVARLRVPCMAQGAAAVRLTQIFEFRPDERRVHWSHAQSPEEVARLETLKCLVHPKSASYPMRAESSGVQGIVIGVARYVAPDRPPEITLHSRRNARLLRSSAEDFLSETRLPCLHGGPVMTATTFIFRFGDEAHGLKPLTLPQLLGHVRGLRRTGYSLDTWDMACPFDLRFQFRQPHLANVVGEVGSTDPARRPLLEFLERADLEGSEVTLDSIYGDTTTVTVPCLHIAIQPQEKTS